MKTIKYYLLAFAILLISNLAFAQQIDHSGSGGGGSFPPAGCSTANGIIFNNAVPCDTGLTYAGSGGPVAVANGTHAAPTLQGATANQGIYFTAGGVNFAVGGTSSHDGTIATGNLSNFTPSGAAGQAYVNADAFSINASTLDTWLSRDAAGIMALTQGNGSSITASSERIYNLSSSANANFERMELGFAAHANVAAIDVAAGGTGTVRNFGVYIGGTLITTINGSGLSINQGNLNVATGVISAAGNINGLSLSMNGDTFVTRSSATVWQHGAADAASPVAQTVRVQSVVGGTSATNGVNWTLIGSLSTGTGTSGDIIVQTGKNPGSGTTQATATTAITIKGETQQVRLPQIASDATLTDTTVCQDTTNHGLFAGSGTAGICLGNVSSIRFKEAWNPLDDGLSVVMALNPGTWRYKSGVADSGARLQVGFLAEDYAHVLPDWTRYDDQDRPNGVDLLAVLPQTVRAIQQLKADNDNLRAEVETLRRSIAR